MNEYEILALAIEIAKRTKTNNVDKQQENKKHQEEEQEDGQKGKAWNHFVMSTNQNNISYVSHLTPTDANWVRIAVGVSIAIQIWIEIERRTLRMVNRAKYNWK